MPVTYVVENYIDVNTLYATSSQESPFYTMDHLYNERPSWPLRFTGVGSAGNPEYICVDFEAQSGLYRVTFAGIFNHNLTTTPERFSLKGCVTDCQSGGAGGCDWEAAFAWEIDMRSRIRHGSFCGGKYQYIFPNSCVKLDQTIEHYRFEFIDPANPDGYIEIGEAVLGEWCQFGKNVHLQPGRPDGPLFYMGNQETLYGQDWPNYYSYAEGFTLVFKNINDIRNLDELQMFLIRVQRNGGRFIIIPDDDKFYGLDMEAEGYYPLCYYVIIKNMGDYAQRLIHGWDKDLREWTLELKTLTTGLKLK